MTKLSISREGLTFNVNPLKNDADAEQRYNQFLSNVDSNRALRILEGINYDYQRINEVPNSQRAFLISMRDNFIVKTTIDIFKTSGIKGWQIADQEAYREIKEEDIPETIPPHNFSPEIIDENLDQLRSQFLTVLKQK
ncbi:hypothetical protein CL656_03095 [bacterium]|nr:hypothetical protein [bacterium]|tara:strand:- start:9337 stop:9750 length:414 start_codon:yes stop_codon:yes gene_type:complete